MECVELKAGNDMVDQLQPWYISVAFSLIFSYCTGRPDMAAFMKRPRCRRNDDAPRIEAAAWVKAMSRRIEASVSRDWSFGFVTWIYLFRSPLNLGRALHAYERKNVQQENNSLQRQLLRQ